MKYEPHLIILFAITFSIAISGKERSIITSIEENVFNPTNTSEISSIIDDINVDSISSYISTLEKFGSRLEILENRNKIAEWILDKYRSFGLSNVYSDEYEARISRQNNFFVIDSTVLHCNIIAEIPGEGAPDEIVLLCAHYDSYNEDNPLVFAPGADDNASGVAALLEIARVFKLNNYIPKRTIRFVALQGEELISTSYSGSKRCADLAYLNGINLRLVINHDMIGYSTRQLNESIVNINRDPSSSGYAQLAINCANNLTEITAFHSNYFGADLGKFVKYGYKGIYFEEYDWNPNYHTGNDLLSNTDVKFCAEVIKVSCTTAFYSNVMPEIVQNVSCTYNEQNNSLKFEWDSNKDFDLEHYNVYYSTNGGSSFVKFETIDTTFTVNDIAFLYKIRYAITAVSNDGYESILEVSDEIITSVEELNQIKDFKLFQNYPNPFNPSTSIQFEITGNLPARLDVFNTLGALVKTLVNEVKSDGSYSIEWSGKDNSDNNVPSGIYFIRLSVGNFTKMCKALLIK